MASQPSGGSVSSSSSSGSSQRNKARKRPWDHSDEDPPSLGSEASLHPPTEGDTTGPGASADGASTSKAVSPLEEPCSTSDEDSESSAENLLTPRKSSGRDQEHAGPIPLSTMKSINGRRIGETLDYQLPCTAAEGITCQIVSHLSAWNEFLCLVFWQLREMPGSSGKLSLVFLCEPSWRCVSPQELHLVTLLACQLLKTHHCVAHIELDKHLFEPNHELLSDVLRRSPSIVSVKFVFREWWSDEDLATAALSLPHLQELECIGGYASLFARLSTFLRSTTSLTTLSVSDRCPRALSSEDFFWSLGQNCSLQELVLPSNLLAEAPPSALAVFAEWLTKSTTLKSFTVAPHSRVFWPLKCILGALVGSKSIVAVDLRCLAVDKGDVHLISKVFELNKILQCFKILFQPNYHVFMPSFVQRHPDKADWDSCLKALVANRTLEEVSLPIDVWDEDQWKELFEALPTKRNLKRASIKAISREPPPVAPKLCAALKETGADEKVSFSVFFTEEEFDERFTCKAFPEVVVLAFDRNMAAVCGILQRMPSLGHITCLHLYIDIYRERDRVVSSALATFLGATRTLKTLTLRGLLKAWLICKEGLMAGLAVNTSLREVRISMLAFISEFPVFSEPLADAINASKNISRLHFDTGGQDWIKDCVFFRRLSTGIADNYTLLNVTAHWGSFDFDETCWFDVWDATRRNNGLVTAAIDFARGSRRDRHCALALERMHGHPELVEEVARLEKVDQTRAVAMVRDGLRSIEGMHQFMRLAGVVKESVSCNESTDGSTQLDALNEDCWRAIRRYLKLYDIRESTTGVPAQ